MEFNETEMQAFFDAQAAEVNERQRYRDSLRDAQQACIAAAAHIGIDVTDLAQAMVTADVTVRDVISGYNTELEIVDENIASLGTSDMNQAIELYSASDHLLRLRSRAYAVEVIAMEADFPEEFAPEPAYLAELIAEELLKLHKGDSLTAFDDTELLAWVSVGHKVATCEYAADPAVLLDAFNIDEIRSSEQASAEVRDKLQAARTYATPRFNAIAHILQLGEHDNKAVFEKRLIEAVALSVVRSSFGQVFEEEQMNEAYHAASGMGMSMQDVYRIHAVLQMLVVDHFRD